ncbi:MAG: glutathione peroxidase [Bacteroidaceae bacterium]|nr:glutathione peroxidase [Bacteroidaceae bacterium]
MKRILSLITLAVGMLSACTDSDNVYQFNVQDAQGQDVSLAQYRGKVLLIVNTATQCGFTPQYSELQTLYEKYQAQGLEILDFPCNQFGGQAPGTQEEIHTFCTTNYHTTFTQFQKLEVNGEGESPLFAYLKEKQGFQGFDSEHPIGKLLDDMLKKQDPDYAQSADIKWNFTKFIVSRKGQVVARFEPTAPINEVEQAVKQELE